MGPKSHIITPKSKKKVKKKSGFFFFFFYPFCYKNVDKMFYQPQKVIFSPQKVKKVKKSKKKKLFLFFTYCVRKSHIYTYIFEFWPQLRRLRHIVCLCLILRHICSPVIGQYGSRIYHTFVSLIATMWRFIRYSMKVPHFCVATD